MKVPLLFGGSLLLRHHCLKTKRHSHILRIPNGPEDLPSHFSGAYRVDLPSKKHPKTVEKNEVLAILATCDPKSIRFLEALTFHTA